MAVERQPRATADSGSAHINIASKFKKNPNYSPPSEPDLPLAETRYVYDEELRYCERKLQEQKAFLAEKELLALEEEEIWMLKARLKGGGRGVGTSTSVLEGNL